MLVYATHIKYSGNKYAPAYITHRLSIVLDKRKNQWTVWNPDVGVFTTKEIVKV